jgi:HEAT repeat protein
MRPHEHLERLAADVLRVLEAGAAAGGVESLPRGAGTLRGIAAQVPALARITEAVDRLRTADPLQRARAVLDLNVLLGMARAGMATAGTAGDLHPVEPSGPWTTDLRLDEPVFTTLVPELADPASHPLNALLFADDEDTVTELRLVGPLLGGLAHPDEDATGRLARDVLPRLGRAVVPDLCRAFRPEGGRADALRLRALCHIDARAGLAAADTALARGSDVVRAQALECLADLDPVGAEKAALRVLGETAAPAEVRETALGALKGARSDEGLEALLGAAEVEGNWSARSALHACPHPEAAPRLRQRLRAAVAEVEAATTGGEGRRPAERAFRLMRVLSDRKDREGLREFLGWLDHPVKEIGAWARDQVLHLYERGEPVVPELISTLSHRDARVLRGVMASLGRVGPAAAAAVPALVERLRDRRPGVREQAATTLGMIKSATGQVLDGLVTALADESRTVRECAADALGRFGAAAGPAVPALARALKDAHHGVRWHAAISLGRIGPAARGAGPALREALGDAQASVRRESLKALGRIGKESVPLLVQMLRDAGQCGNVISAVRKGPETDGKIVQELVRIAGEPGHPCRAAAVAVLGELGPAGSGAVAVLADALQDDAEDVRRVAAQALWKLGPVAEAAVPALGQALTDEASPVREYAAWALQLIGPAGRAAAPALARALQDPNWSVRGHARKALKAIERQP